MAEKLINGLSKQRSEFVWYYLESGDGTNSAIRAGYSKRTAAAQASRLLKDVKVRAAIRARQKKVEERSEIQVADVVKQLGRMAFLDPADLLDEDGRPKPLKDWPSHARMAVQGIKVVTVGNSELGFGEVLDVRIADRNSAADKLMKHLGGYLEDNSQRGDALAELLSEINGANDLIDSARKR